MRRAILVAVVLTSLCQSKPPPLMGISSLNTASFSPHIYQPFPWTLVRVVTVSATFRAFMMLYSPPASFACLMG